MHPASALERFVTNNPTMLQSPLARLVPQTVQAIPRTGVAVTKVWGDAVSRTLVSYSDPLKLHRMRTLFHPGFGDTLVYPRRPDRTLNYWRGPIRNTDIEHTKTLLGAVNSQELQRFEDVVITEVWDGAGTRISVPIDFLQSLHLFRITPAPLGSYLGWEPFDLTYLRHLIVPISLTVGGEDFDLNEIRENWESGKAEATYSDRTVTFQFMLVRPAIFAPTNVQARGL